MSSSAGAGEGRRSSLHFSSPVTASQTPSCKLSQVVSTVDVLLWCRGTKASLPKQKALKVPIPAYAFYLVDNKICWSEPRYPPSLPCPNPLQRHFSITVWDRGAGREKERSHVLQFLLWFWATVTSFKTDCATPVEQNTLFH